jgi:esterase/lipase
MVKLNLALTINIMFLLGYLNGCTTVNVMKDSKERAFETRILHNAPKDKAKAVIILLHGLNLAPQRMDDWAKILSFHDAYVIQFSLYGHTGNVAHMQTVSVDIWRNQFETVMSISLAKAKELGVPLYFMGFSLGALVNLEWLASQKEQPAIKKMVLIAPAISIPWYSRVTIKTLSIFGNKFLLPSRSPKNYRANRGTSVAAYLSLFKLKDSLEEKKYRFANINTLVLIDRHDELVNSSNISRAIKQFKLSNWRLEIVDNYFAYDNYGFRHLMVDQEAVGKELWQDLSQMVLMHFDLGNSKLDSF